jgi:hypothetical protein
MRLGRRAPISGHAVALIVLLNKYLGPSHGKIAALLRDWFGLRVGPSGVPHALHRAARQAAPTYAAWREQIRGSPVVSPDELESGWAALVVVGLCHRAHRRLRHSRRARV